MLKLQEDCVWEGLSLSVLFNGNDPLISRARQDLVAKFMEMEGATHLLFIDADIEFKPEQVFRLLRFDSDVAAAVYPLKRLDWARVKTLVLSGEDNPKTACLRYVVEMEKPAMLKDGFGRARYAGTGFMMIRRSALEALESRYPELRYHVPGRQGEEPKGPERWAFFDCLLNRDEKIFLSEDFSFCRRWTDIGGEIWVDLRSQLNHLGFFTFEGNLQSEWMNICEKPSQAFHAGTP